jgi:hypothetical protein
VIKYGHISFALLNLPFGMTLKAIVNLFSFQVISPHHSHEITLAIVSGKKQPGWFNALDGRPKGK